MKMDEGYCEGDTCNRGGCQGVIATHPVENCSCHVAPPCSACTSPRNFCPACGWEEADEPVEQPKTSTPVQHDCLKFKSNAQRFAELDRTKISWMYLPHTHFTMKKRGVYPLGTTREQVAAEVKGSFGGRFISFGNGEFEYIAYTD